MQNKLYNILEKFVIENNITINPEDFKLQLISNPDFPSIKSISDTLDYFGIENIVANVPKDALEQLPECFLAVLQTKDGASIAQVHQNENRVKVIKVDGLKEKYTISEFKDKWNGTIIAVEKNEQKSRRAKVKVNSTSTLLLLGILVLVGLLSSLQPVALAYTILAVAGCLLSFLIVKESLGIHTQATSKICNSAERNTSCSEVINSKTSKIFGLVSLSDASIAYFVSEIVIIGLLGFTPSFFFWLSAVSVPVVFYSIYSQKFQIKKWCPLCLGISAVLLSQAVLVFMFYHLNFQMEVVYALKAVLAFSLVYASWLSIKKVLINSLKFGTLQTDFLKFKRNENLFNTLLQKDKLPSHEFLPADSIISFGNPHALIVITSVTNPLCGFCTKAFEAYNHLLKIHGDKLRLNIVFNVTATNLESPSSQISQQIIDLYQKNPKEAYRSLQNWFKNRDINSWQSQYGIPDKSANLSILKSHAQWCEHQDIHYTPETLIGNHFFPKEYEIKDLSLFIDFLIEQNKTQKKELSIN